MSKHIEEIVEASVISINLDQINFDESSPEQIKKLADSITTNTALKFVYFSQKKINTLDFLKALPLFKAMSTNKNIQLLGLNDCAIQDLDKDALVKLLGCIKISGIKKLIISKGTLNTPFPT